MLYLSSGSPRRQELLKQLGLNCQVVNAPIDETALPNENPQAFVLRIAKEKAFAGFKQIANQSTKQYAWVIGGDTAVVLGDEVFGKPCDKADACKMLRALSGKTHTVLSGVAIVHNGEVFSAVNQTQVTFKALSTEDVEAYWLTDEPKGKAGAYAIQGLGARFIRTIQGSYSGVMGLPLYELDQLLTESGYKTIE